VPRAKGWSVLAITALEITTLALVSRLLEGDGKLASASSAAVRQAHRDTIEQCHPERVEGQPSEVEAPVQPQQETTPQDFLTESAGENARYYRAIDESGELLAGFYGDGRVRLADDAHRLAGMVQNGRADLLEIADNTWSELFVRMTPEGKLQLELRDGPYGGRVFTCESVEMVRPS
jgi:hypothetical protein